jgi:hypothetical protein
LAGTARFGVGRVCRVKAGKSRGKTKYFAEIYLKNAFLVRAGNKDLRVILDVLTRNGALTSVLSTEVDNLPGNVNPINNSPLAEAQFAASTWAPALFH